ncbi:hypothetical protein INR49_002439 [Caranx melampygus]|nr:hypothetical protein INR49_002439 [Caranx melampygus]
MTRMYSIQKAGHQCFINTILRISSHPLTCWNSHRYMNTVQLDHKQNKEEGNKIKSKPTIMAQREGERGETSVTGEPQVVQEKDDEEVDQQATEDSTSEESSEDEDSKEQQEQEPAQQPLDPMVQPDLQQYITFMEEAYQRSMPSTSVAVTMCLCFFWERALD